MKKEEMTEVTYCDFCGKKEDWAQNCMICGKHWCYDCGENISETLPHSIFCSGGDDGHFCKECLRNPPVEIKPLIAAYRVVQDIRNESKRFQDDIEIRSKKAEAAVKALVKP